MDMHSSEPEQDATLKKGSRQHELDNANMPARVDPSAGRVPQVIKSDYLTASLHLDTSSPPRLLGVSFDAHTSTGQLVATYRTVGRTHPLLSDRVVAIFSEMPARFDPAVAFRRIFKIISNPLLTTWEVVPAYTPSHEGAPTVYRSVPKLEALVKNPELIENNLTTQWVSQETIIRLGATVSPERGCATVTIDRTPLDGSDSMRTSIKLLIPAEGECSLSQARALLQEQVMTTFARMYEGGLQSVTSFLEDDSEVVAGIASGSFETLQRMDQDILTGESAGFFHETRLLDSGATASLVLGKQLALLTVMPNEERPEIQYRISFECEGKDEQLSAAQLHYLLKMYGLLTSDSKEEREEGISMCIEARGSVMRRPVPPSSTGFSSARDHLKVRERPRNYLPQDILGDDRIERLSDLWGLEIGSSWRVSKTEISAALAGTLILTVQRGAAACEKLKQEDMTQMQVHLLNDGDLDLYVVNGLSTVFYGRLRPADELGIDSAEAAEMILELFADQPSTSWRFLMSKITVPEQEMFGTHPFGLHTTWQNEFPPLDDLTGLRMYEEAASFHAWTLGALTNSLLGTHVRYVGRERVELSVRSSTSYPGLQVVFESGVLRQLCIVDPPFMTTVESGRDNILASFHSDTLTIGSANYQEFMDRFAIALHECSLNRFRLSKPSWAEGMIEPIHRVLSDYMTRKG